MVLCSCCKEVEESADLILTDGTPVTVLKHKFLDFAPRLIFEILIVLCSSFC